MDHAGAGRGKDDELVDESLAHGGEADMSPLRGEEFTGRSVEEAIERGLRALGRKRTDVDIEVLEKGKPANVLGMGGEDARVLLSFQEDAVAEPEPAVDEAEIP